MSKPFTPTPHPVLGLPTPAQMAAMGHDKWAQLMLEREERILKERAEPFPHWFEPPIWKVCDALLGFPWVDPVWAEKMRKHLGFDKPVKILLINGGNRGGKSEYASDRVMRVLRYWKTYWPERHEPASAWCLHSTLPMSKKYQQPLFYQALPPELRGKDIKSKETYITYKQKTGFSEDNFVLPGGADCSFKAYEQDVKGIEGGNIDIIWPDELVPADWVETMELRIAERAGWMIVTFTPVQGYTETVRMFQDGAQVVQESTAYLLPKDGGEPDVARALGLTAAELAEVKRAEADKRAAYCPQSRPEDCNLWLDTPGAVRAEDGREFETVPRVMKCVGSSPEQPRACVFFYTADNPYGNPKSVWATISGKAAEFKRERFYGVANKVFSARFPKFNLKVHIVPANAIPQEGTNYHVIDPCDGRNFFQGWFRRTPNRVYLYREWPGGYAIPDVGLPGAWALPSGKHPDGKRGPAQNSFGWGHLRYKLEIARLEGWTEYASARPDGLSEEDWREQQRAWHEANGAREVIQERFIDSRFASTPKMQDDKPVTLIEEFAELGLNFTPTPGDDISEGVQMVQNALDYDVDKPVDYFNCPELLISAECVNTIYALQTWTGYSAQGKRSLEGATKDPIDILRYFFLADCPYLGGHTEDEEEEESEFAPKRQQHY